MGTPKENNLKIKELEKSLEKLEKKSSEYFWKKDASLKAYQKLNTVLRAAYHIVLSTVLKITKKKTKLIFILCWFYFHSQNYKLYLSVLWFNTFHNKLLL